MIDALTLDQIRTFLAVAEAGSFSAAARGQNRATSAITYAIEKMEDQFEVKLFDRSTYRPVLTEAGRTLLPRARRIAEEIDGLRLAARGMAGGLEAEVAISVDAMFPMEMLSVPLREFQGTFPGTQLRITVETLGCSSRLVADGQCLIGLTSEFGASGLDLVSVPAGELSLIMVVAPTHPLATISGAIGPEILKDHVQLVLADRSNVTGLRDHSVYSGQTWRLSDLGAKQEMLRAGLGFGSLPTHLANGDLASGRLVALELATSFGKGLRFPMVLVRRNDRPIGPATHWLVERLAAFGSMPYHDDASVEVDLQRVPAISTASVRIAGKSAKPMTQVPTVKR